jgi:hypothetical protein
MPKPILVFKLIGEPLPEDKNFIHQKINSIIGDDYYKIILFGDYKEASVELLTKGRRTATLTKQLKKLCSI